MKTIAIIFHDANYLTSGGTRSMLDIVDFWISTKEFNILAVFPAKKGPAIDYLKERNVPIFCKKYGINSTYVHLPVKAWGKYPKSIVAWFLGIFNTRFFIQRELLLAGVDLVYTNTSTPHIGAWLQKSLQIPHIWHFREFGKEDHGFVRLWGNKHFYKTVNKHTDHIIVISKALRAKVEQYTSLPISVIYDDLSQAYINPKKTKDFEHRPMTLLIAGMLSKGKGQIQAIEAVEKLVKKGLALVLYIAGTGMDEQKLQTYVQAHGLQQQVVFLGLVKDMNTLRETIDVGVVCSHCEAFGRITIEGMLSNMIMVGADTGGTPELIQEGKTGFLYRWNDSGDLAAKLEYIYNNPKDMENIRKEGYQKGLEYTKGRCAKECRDLIVTCIEEAGKRKVKAYEQLRIPGKAAKAFHRNAK
jgi:glycosyltransferase involved in cell wall biosynthesis